MRRRARTTRAACIAALGLWGGLAPAQPGLNPVDQQLDDVSPLGNSLRVQPLDLRRPIEFDRVYRIDPTPDLFGGSRKFARIDNGVIAVFDRSEYSRAARGVLSADIPAGTVFYLGSPESVLSSTYQARGPSILAVDRSAMEQNLKPPGPRPSQKLSQQITPTIFSGEAYRQYRVGQLLDQAARGG